MNHKVKLSDSTNENVLLKIVRRQAFKRQIQSIGFLVQNQSQNHTHECVCAWVCVHVFMCSTFSVSFSLQVKINYGKNHYNSLNIRQLNSFFSAIFPFFQCQCFFLFLLHFLLFAIFDVLCPKRLQYHLVLENR